MSPLQECNSQVYQRVRQFSVQDTVHLSTLFDCLKELAATVNCPNEISSTSEQVLILEPKEEEQMSPNPEH